MKLPRISIENQVSGAINTVVLYDLYFYWRKWDTLI